MHVWACLGMSGHAWPHPNNSSSLTFLHALFLVTVPIQKRCWLFTHRDIDDQRIQFREAIISSEKIF